jgi:hypothetical protein
MSVKRYKIISKLNLEGILELLCESGETYYYKPSIYDSFSEYQVGMIIELKAQKGE